MTLRPYQEQAIRELRHRFARGAKRVLLVLATGGGKTVILAEIARSAMKHGKRVLVVVHRKELIDQTVDKLAAVGITAGVIMADDPRRDDAAAVQVASIQTLARRGERPAADILIVDEAHHSASNTMRDLIDAYPDAITIGLTATPRRTDGQGLSDLFDDHVVVVTPKQLIEMGALVPVKAFAFDAPDLHDVGEVAGDYHQGQLELAANTNVLVGHIVEEYLRVA